MTEKHSTIDNILTIILGAAKKDLEAGIQDLADELQVEADGVREELQKEADEYRRGDNPDITGSVKSPFAEKPKASKETIEAEAKDKRRTAYITQFRKSIADGALTERTFLERTVQESAPEVYTLGGNALLRAHARACVYVGNNALAIRSFREAQHIGNDEALVLAIAEYERGNAKMAQSIFRSLGEKFRSDAWAADARLIHAHASHAEKPKAAEAYEVLLEADTRHHPDAAIFLGTVFHNEGQFENARKYFAQATKLRPTSVPAWLGMLRAQNAQGDDAMSGGHGFYEATRSDMSVHRFQFELQRERAPLPEFHMNARQLYALLD